MSIGGNVKIKTCYFKISNRIQAIQKSSNIFDKGFKRFGELKPNIPNCYSRLLENPLLFFRIADEYIDSILEDVFEKLKMK